MFEKSSTQKTVYLRWRLGTRLGSRHEDTEESHDDQVDFIYGASLIFLGHVLQANSIKKKTKNNELPTCVFIRRISETSSAFLQCNSYTRLSTYFWYLKSDVTFLCMPSSAISCASRSSKAPLSFSSSPSRSEVNMRMTCMNGIAWTPPTLWSWERCWSKRSSSMRRTMCSLADKTTHKNTRKIVSAPMFGSFWGQIWPEGQKLSQFCFPHLVSVLILSDLLLVWMSPSVSPSPSEPSPSCWAVVVLMAPVLELTLPGPAGWPSTVVSPYALLRPDTEETWTKNNNTKHQECTGCK